MGGYLVLIIQKNRGLIILKATTLQNLQKGMLGRLQNILSIPKTWLQKGVLPVMTCGLRS
ncbi:hypothetical protein SAMN05216167_13815 [Spirosoma endophyticum]|uniref:Uncharacterized protein n=1 Tax=Spirosoma endophyticum TaxID=662367 RepID=A0A1I2H3Q5_9BACT|nr:hypothetical protein SAMN05216167_13815 [Spirosoma endophyticum]